MHTSPCIKLCFLLLELIPAVVQGSSALGDILELGYLLVEWK
jgi:hypothetical protein